MKVLFQNVVSLTTTPDTSTFVFVGDDYPFSAAKAFAYKLSKDKGLPLSFHKEPCRGLSPDSIHLFGTLEDPTSLLMVPECAYRIIPAKEGTCSDKSFLKVALGAQAHVVEVPTPTDKTLPSDIAFVSSMMGVPCTEECAKVVATYCLHSFSGVVQLVELSESFGGLVDKANLPRLVSGSVVSYADFKDSLLFKTPNEASLLLSRAEDPLAFVTPLLNDLAMYVVLQQEDQNKTSVREIAQTYGQPEWFLKNRLLPRLRTMGLDKLLSLMKRLSEMQSSVLRGEAVDIQTQMASIILLTLLEG